MNTTHSTKTKRLIAALGVAAGAVMAPAALFAGAGTAHAEQPWCGYNDYTAGYNNTILQDCPYSGHGSFPSGQYEQGVRDRQAGLSPNP